jgi:1,2-diacylglycerol 3-alpha-glucosyltransferase
LDGDTVGDFAAEVATRFANRCDAAIAPSNSVRELMLARGVTVPVHVIPTGIDTRRIATGQGGAARRRWKISPDAVVIGHLGRLAEEKNLTFLARALALALQEAPTARALIVGDGPARGDMEGVLKEAGVGERVTFTGTLTGRRLLDACAAMDVFAFASTSETQGLVVAEVMAAGTSVIALDASGVREVVHDQRNGRLLPADSTPALFARALVAATEKREVLARWSKAALVTAAEFDRRSTSQRLLALYAELIEAKRQRLEALPPVARALQPVVDRVATEGQIIADKAGALIAALNGSAPSTSTHEA